MIKENQLIPSVFIVFLLFVNPPNSNIHGKDSTYSITAGGLKRTYLLHIPRTIDPGRSMPLLIALHGGGGTGQNMVKLTMGGFNELSDKNGFVVVYPDGIDRHWNDGRNNDQTGYQANHEKIDDVGFISALIDNLIKKMKIDPNRVYVTGMSNGAIMSYRLACELSEKIAAIAPVAGNIPQKLLPSCSPANPVSVLAINNASDPLVPFNGGDVTGPFGMRKLGKVLSASESVKFWANHDKCSATPVITIEPDNDPQDGTRIKKVTYIKGENNSEVILYIIEGGGHTWPGGSQYLNEKIIGRTSRDLNADKVIWDFFEKHSRD
jgi:polyhydroxybutyrate depolymerase